MASISSTGPAIELCFAWYGPTANSDYGISTVATVAYLVFERRRISISLPESYEKVLYREMFIQFKEQHVQWLKIYLSALSTLRLKIGILEEGVPIEMLVTDSSGHTHRQKYTQMVCQDEKVDIQWPDELKANHRYCLCVNTEDGIEFQPVVSECMEQK